MVTSQMEDQKETSWFLDIGCSNHMTGKKDWFVDLDTSVKMKVRFADSSAVAVEGKGKILIQQKIGGHAYISEVFYV